MNTRERLDDMLGGDQRRTDEAASMLLIDMAFSGLARSYGEKEARRMLHQWVDDAKAFDVPMSVTFQRNA